MKRNASSCDSDVNKLIRMLKKMLKFLTAKSFLHKLLKLSINI